MSSDTFTPLEVRFLGHGGAANRECLPCNHEDLHVDFCHTCIYQGVRIYSCNPTAMEVESGGTPGSFPKCVAVNSVRDPLSKCKAESNSENLTPTSGHHRLLHKHTNIHTTHTV